MRKRLIAAFAAIALAVGLIGASLKYYSFVSQTIYTESTAHLAEIYNQANQSLHSLVGRNWSTMRMWVPYLQDASSETQIEEFIARTKEEVGYTDFYFISQEGNYQTADGKTGYLDLKASLPKLIFQQTSLI